MIDFPPLSNAARSNLLTLQKTQSLIDRTTQRLATGLRVGSALDNPDNFFTARGLKSRADDLSRLMDGIGQGLRTLETAEKGIQASLDLLDLAESYLVDIVEQFNAGEIEFGVGDPINLTEIEPAAADFISYAGTQDSGGPVVVMNGGDDFTLSGNLWKRVFVDYTITADTVLEFEYASTIIPEISAIGFDNDNTFNNDNDRFFLYGTQLTGLNYSAPAATYQYPGGGAYQSYSIPVGTFFTGNFDYITFINDDDSGPTGTSMFRNVTLREGPLEYASTTPASIKEGYAKILSQLDQLVVDAHYRGINLLEGDDFEVWFNEDGSSRLQVEGIDGTSQGLGLLSDLSSIEAVYSQLDAIRAARESLRSYGATISTEFNILKVRDTFTRGIINTLESGADDLTLADQNEEGAKLLALQTRQALAQTSLSFAAQSGRNVLNLFA